MLLLILFAVGYVAIVLEQPLRLNKAAPALATGVVCWAVSGHAGALEEHLGGVAGILFFVLGAMTIVELIDAHDGFEIITSRIGARGRRPLLVTVIVLSFVLSAVLDNLTTAIVMMSLLRRLVAGERDRMYFGAMVIIAANAGGAWSPIGDVTTTMLWAGGQITSTALIATVLVPSLVSVAVPALWIGLRMKGKVERPDAAVDGTVRAPTTPFERRLVFFTGTGALVMVPVFKAITHLPPFMGVLLGVGVLWTLTELIHKRKNDEYKSALSVAGALQRIDSTSILFFLGILLAIGALEADGVLADLAARLDGTLGNRDVVVIAIGLASAVVDNVPLVAAAQGMYPLTTYPVDHDFWHFMAYAAGTGGSILIIGSAAGVAVMGLQRISFGWYLRRISLPALLGYAAGAAAYLALAAL